MNNDRLNEALIRLGDLLLRSQGVGLAWVEGENGVLLVVSDHQGHELLMEAITQLVETGVYDTPELYMRIPGARRMSRVGGDS